MSSLIKSLVSYSAFIGAGLSVGSIANAQSMAQIDLDLTNQIDFRSSEFSSCLDRTQCKVGIVTVVGERRLDEDSEWLGAPLYWDPIDGFGIQDGAQNDEIDINERLIVRFDNRRAIERVWLSDLFVLEDRRYGSSETDLVEGEPENAEIAAFSLLSDGLELFNTTVPGKVRLPWAQFNQEIDGGFEEDGDLRRRILVNGDIVTIVIPGEDLTLQTPISADEEKSRSLFEGLETVELDISELLLEFNAAALFEVGTTNFEFINAVAQNPENIDKMIRVAQERRTSIQLSNGEVSVDVDEISMVEEIFFFTPFDASNDFSVAGIVFKE